MRISDWSSDVCSSDLAPTRTARPPVSPELVEPVMSTTTTDRTKADLALRMERVRKTYEVGDQEVVALDCADLTVGSDEIVALIGPSGSDKTTLCSIAGDRKSTRLNSSH